MSLRQRWKICAPPFSEAEGPVKQHERAPRTVNLIVHLEAVQIGVFAVGVLLLLSISDNESRGGHCGRRDKRSIGQCLHNFLLFVHFIVLISSARRSWDSLIPASIPEL